MARTEPFSLYLHIPYCLHRCPYCDFNCYALPSLPEKEYVAAVLAELDYRAARPEWHGRVVQSIYFGGGTPSLFNPASLRKIIAVVLKTFPVDDNIEVTLEANPGTVTFDTLSGFLEAGINRLSIGAQSFSPEVLRALGRMHTVAQIEEAVVTARDVGFANISLDLIYGAPGQSIADLQSDLMEVGRLDPSHVSPYGLTIEKGTPFYTSFKKGILKLPREEMVVDMMRRINNELSGCGLLQYEISNYAKPGKEARHNLAYWNGEDYLGLGAGAHSFNASLGETDGAYGRRWSNFATPEKYMEQASVAGAAESWGEVLDERGAIFEYFFLGLRKTAGVSLNAFEKKFHRSAKDLYAVLLEMLISERLLQLDGDMLALTSRGLVLADSVIENFSSPMLSGLSEAEQRAFASNA
jgi:oxygen-independent coproporphyrinogen III oxidase